MKFIHIADVHLGACPDAGRAYTKNRGKEIWNTFEKVLQVCEEDKVDLLLIAGDFFHRQPLLRELKEVDYLFSKLTHTKVVLIAGNHDYVNPDSYYRKYKWSSEVYFLLDDTLDHVEFPEIETCVYGLSYTRKEITEPLYDDAFPQKKQPIEILLAHGGDEKHIPVGKDRLMRLGYDYVALGHIHRMKELERNRIVYAGSLEPTDKNDIGQHGYFVGEITREKAEVHFVPFASRLYIHTEIQINETMTKLEVKDRIAEEIPKKGIENCYKIILTGFCDQEMELEQEELDVYGNILELQNMTRPAYDFEKIQRANAGNLLGKYIESLKDAGKDSVEYMALFEGVGALLDSKRG